MKKQRIKKILVAVAFATATISSNAQTPYDSFAPSEKEKPMLELTNSIFRAYNSDTSSVLKVIELNPEDLLLTYLDKNDSVLAQIQLEPSNFKFISVDPKASDAPNWTPYRAFFNNPIRYIDPDGQWEKDANGNLVAEKNDNAWTFAEYLNTSPEIAINMLGTQGFTVNDKGILNLNVGDIYKVEHSSPTPDSREDLGFLGNNIRERAGSEYSKNMFENYWNGGGDVEMSNERFAGVLIYVKENNPSSSNETQIKLVGSSGNTYSGSKKAVSFYSSSEYDKVYGTSTLYYNQSGNIVGFYDNYDFDSKAWGQRSTKNEIITRAVNYASPSTAQPFKIRYGYSNR